ncbi:kinase-like domain-containing protein [Protomyces lactucae-debilis]|uniref:cAMP-dependent protein kinase n=1 Tax=Protomyces lactucae-debilis TaxID=2754530 RepID=A0A1Y2FM81_PROLT|nr:kinase-like domain-containing protein [Protomyces lactucae-debilis]ORY85080.1 kinase-like domain-containing protein [Protomyces lactucae-debilis]
MKAFASKLKRSKSATQIAKDPQAPTQQHQNYDQPGYTAQAAGNHYTHEKEVPRSMPPLAKTPTGSSAQSQHHQQHQQHQQQQQGGYSPPTSDMDRMMVDDARSTQQAASMRSNQSTPTMPTSHTMAYEQELPLNKQTIQSGLSVSRGPALVARETRGKYTLADFQIQRTLGTGSFGRVHLVQSRHNSRFYAIKVLKKQQVVKMKQIEHTNDERSMLRKVKHPFTITLWGTFFDSKNLYMVMDFIEGGELFSLLRKSHRFPNPVAKFYAAEVCLALDYLHHNDIIYRDLKPENLLLDRHGHIKITDFGFAKEVPDITWTLCGTPDYLAPEVVASKGYNKSVDWWSLGILTYEMLAGHPPFYDPNPMKLYENILAGHVRYPSYFEPAAKDFLQKLLTADLTKRYGNLRNGSRDIMEHAWFSEVNWERLARRDIEPPYTPPLKGAAGDAHLFDVYSEDQEPYGQQGPDPYGHLFPAF